MDAFEGGSGVAGRHDVCVVQQRCLVDSYQRFCSSDVVVIESRGLQNEMEAT